MFCYLYGLDLGITLWDNDRDTVWVSRPFALYPCGSLPTVVACRRFPHFDNTLKGVFYFLYLITKYPAQGGIFCLCRAAGNLTSSLADSGLLQNPRFWIISYMEERLFLRPSSDSSPLGPNKISRTRRNILFMSGRRDSNPESHAPEACMLAITLRPAPTPINNWFKPISILTKIINWCGSPYFQITIQLKTI